MAVALLQVLLVDTECVGPQTERGLIKAWLAIGLSSAGLGLNYSSPLSLDMTEGCFEISRHWYDDAVHDDIDPVT